MVGDRRAYLACSMPAQSRIFVTQSYIMTIPMFTRPRGKTLFALQKLSLVNLHITWSGARKGSQKDRNEPKVGHEKRAYFPRTAPSTSWALAPQPASAPPCSTRPQYSFSEKKLGDNVHIVQFNGEEVK
jgi:hypothetical protein